MCDFHYAQMARHQQYVSPMEALFDGPGDEGSPGTATGSAAPRFTHMASGGATTGAMSDQAQEALQRAAERAVLGGRPEVDTEHLLYELPENELVGTILRRFDVSTTELRQQVEAEAPEGVRGEIPQARISPRLKSAVERAFQAAHELGHRYVGPEHLLIGLVETPESLAGTILLKLGVTADAVKAQIESVVGRGSPDGRFDRASETPRLDQFSRNLSALARSGKLDPVIGRSKEVEAVIEVLARRKKNNPVLIGEPGVGKTAIVEGLAQRVVANDVPEILRGKRVVELNVNSLVAGAKFRGEFEERVKQVMDEVKGNRDHLLIFIDELHTIVGAGQGGGEGGLDIANTFKPALSRGELNLIGATTLNEYQKYIEKDAALERRFQPILVGEPSVEQTISILRGVRDKLEAHHKVTIHDSALIGAAELSDRYITGRFLPDKAIDLVDQASARVRISETSRPAHIQDAEAEIAQLRREAEHATAHKQFDRAKALHESVNTAQAALDSAVGQWKKTLRTNTTDVRLSDVAQIVASLTGIPVAQLTAEEKERLLELEGRLHRRVIGQEAAIRAVSDAVRLSRSGLQRQHRPVATFLFLGPTGVGKTELAKALAEAVYGGESSIVRIDMSEYSERHTVARLIGSPPGYVGHDEGGQLTERVRRRPYSVILFDEIEKAHPDIYNVLLQVLDDGRLTDGKGRVVDFSNTIIIATSNLGSEMIVGGSAKPGFLTGRRDDLKEEVMQVVKGHFRPEFINRIDDIILFGTLSEREIKEIVRLQLEAVARGAHGQDISLTFRPALVDHLSRTAYSAEFGARELRRQIRHIVETKLATKILAGEVREHDAVACDFDPTTNEVVFTVARPEAGGSYSEKAAKDAELTEELLQSFPASDPPSITRP